MSILPQLLANSIIAASVYALIALGFSLSYGTTKFFNMAHGIVAAVGGYATWYLTKSAGAPLYVSILIGIISAGLLGVLLDVIVFTPLRNRRASPMVLLIASLGASTMIQAVLAMLFTSQFQTLSPFLESTKVYQIGGAIITQIQVIMLLSGLVILACLAATLRFTMFGKAVKAVSDDEEVSKIIGINTTIISRKIFFISSSIAGLAGILVGFDTGLEPTMGLSLLLKGVIAAIIGGIGSIEGAVLGALLLGLAENFGIWKISGEWKDAIAFSLLIIFLIFRPSGIIKK